jgi:hypothetical protein
MSRSRVFTAFAAVALLAGMLQYSAPAHAQGQVQPTARRYFPETGKTVQGRFLQYWEQNGGLPQQGFPLSEEMAVRSEIDGKTYTMQFFERAVFEWHPENQQPNDVLLSLLGSLRYNAKYPGGAPGQKPNTDPGSVMFNETGRRVGGSFLQYFREHGGIRQQGLPISDEFTEVSQLDGKPYTVQYFERAVFEWHPTNQPPFNVLLVHLGRFAYEQGPSVSQPPVFPPLPQGRARYNPEASDRYLIWLEGFPQDEGTGFDRSLDIMGLDLKTNTPIVVSNAPGDQISAKIDGSVVVWKSETQGCPQCVDPGIYAKDLATGQEYVVATQGGETAHESPVVAGRMVGWIQRGPSLRIMLSNIDTGATNPVREFPAANAPFLTDLRMSGNYVVWNEVVVNSLESPGKESRIMAYAPGSLQPFTVMTYVLGERASYIPTFAIDGSRLVVSDVDGALYLYDLAQGVGTRTKLPYQGFAMFPLLRGDVFLFSSSPPPIPTDIRGIKLSRPGPAVPVAASQPNNATRYRFTLANGWVVYSASTTAGSPLVAIPLPEGLR